MFEIFKNYVESIITNKKSIQILFSILLFLTFFLENDAKRVPPGMNAALFPVSYSFL